ncbi:Pyrroline-5-carboxylate reductase [Fulvia fulva]|uniref:Pyrroline-5-carboxylate reductase n=1 Tax=Passalora fulva TaxID=5499 RepID=A0A9Q8LIY7_PASFU|nr:Pyrroline-5-carboxylate reductase [Fulvia fulva]KAK4624461.1 Pyrroline-5-carboxylate reductase [Fulvia fulva]KAK4626002.1 Pyrroline-5-carboxylate reductase [Fulvia fulva]UJO17994.1 Pyrroline-5-carboxylate reductase [Fulvia fulva]WPV14902.1 Pyrroline-5-carboxylate reductase [Fulvia fulva]WPV30050.1 Pyrroline-5-carboxylate reductase [Fulvia fulva]
MGSLDDILKQALAVQSRAHRSWLHTKPELEDGGLTMTVLGCGTMGTAVLGGILQSLQSHSEESAAASYTTTSTEPTPQRLPSKFHACVHSAHGAERVKAALSKYNARLKIHEDGNLQAVQDADIVLLACETNVVARILELEGMREALAGTLLISICAGLSESSLCDNIYGRSPTPASPADVKACRIVRAMPNAAAAIRESMTVIAIPNPPLDADRDALLTWIFTRIGRVVRLPADNMDACTALCGSGTAFAAVVVEAMAAGAISMGIPREQAYTMASQTVRGATGLMLRGEHPAVLRDKMSTPGGCTTMGLSVLEEGGARGTIAKAVRDTTIACGR